VFTTIDLVRLLIGIVILYWGAEWLIRGSATLARTLGVKPLVIGLTVVAYGSSAPELAVSTEAVRDHATPIALGNVIGSCAANISLILGLTALIAPPTIDARIIRREVPILLGSAIAVPVMLYDGVLSRTEGILLIACAVVFTILTLTVSSRDDADEDDVEKVRDATAAGGSYGGRGRPKGSGMVAIVMSAAGIGLLVLGSSQFVRGSRAIAGELGMSERMLGMTIIALGTSLPELIASLVAATRGQSALAVGSVIGSNRLPAPDPPRRADAPRRPDRPGRDHPAGGRVPARFPSGDPVRGRDPGRGLRGVRGLRLGVLSLFFRGVGCGQDTSFPA
jgi:cation:H+ antiporter